MRTRGSSLTNLSQSKVFAVRPALACLVLCASVGSGAPLPVTPPAVVSRDLPASATESRLIKLGIGDSINMQVYGQPDLALTTYIADDGSIAVPLAGNVSIAGLSPQEAARRIEKALRDGKYLVQPQVTLTVEQSRSQRVTVLGEVRTPGRYTIESDTPIYDVLAQAGGATSDGGDRVYVLRPQADGSITRYEINLNGLTGAQGAAVPLTKLQGGDSIVVPRAAQVYIRGEVQKPERYRIDNGMTVEQALTLAGGVTPRGSDRRIEIQRRDAGGTYRTIKPRLSDPVMSDDIIRVKERIF